MQKIEVEFDRFLLRKVHAAALLRWRGYQVPLRIKLRLASAG